VTATALTLVLLPALYYLLERRIAGHARKVELAVIAGERA
jgi:hypothetical protein